ncbi:ligase-associated DNA damage response endonuclease PdeM [Acidovorax sp. NCPPB 3576]|uniref:ligase-associated DNA damage response endonuclease PdeM n=1 Tax=Acidovorax sp. NCPPB 3576 TaxID=2940488 RepID=UPI00234A674C|nr:ligase-associated DNA damage response endonuclease PdeM [Acidovorax sp. NCPPB 3576]WCM87977.1 ligase-associated DNA damage response endonuclease PdeM [Acidovorax sp. NCPPB 3576]
MSAADIHTATQGAAICHLAGTEVHLLPDRSLWWPAGRTLFVADVHLGKSDTFRARGLPVPSGTTRDNLARLAAQIAQQEAQRLVVLGDFLHAAEAQSPAVLAALSAWRAAHAALEVVLVRGNHDGHAGDPPAGLGIAIVDEPWPIGPFACCHHPQAHGTLHVLAGHVHPAVVLRGRGRDALRLPCFAVEPQLTVLPAFGEFTGGQTMATGPERRFFAAGGGRVWAVPGWVDPTGTG